MYLLKKLWYVGAFLALAGVLAACAPASEKVRAPAEEAKLKPQYGGTFIMRAGTGERASFDPRDARGVVSQYQHIERLTGSSLIRWPFNEVPTAEPVQCDLCERWEQPNDTTYIFYLRKGVKWQNKPPLNGRELTAEDIRWALTDGEGYDSKNPQYRNNYRNMTIQFGAKVEAVDKYTVKITLKEPAASFLLVLAIVDFTYPAREAVEASKIGTNPLGFIGSGLADLRYVIGTGPFMLKEYTPGVGSAFIRNPDYFRKDEEGNQLPYLDEVRVLHLQDAKIRTNAMLAGRLHESGVWLDGSDVVKLERAGNFEVAVGGGGVVGGILFNAEKPPFNDVRVRRAFHLIADRFEIMPPINMAGMQVIRWIPSEWRLYGTPIEEVLKLPGYRPDKTQDLEEAKRLLREAGLGDGFSFTMNIYPGVKGEEVATVMQSQLKPFKIDTKMEPLDRATFAQRQKDGAYQAVSHVCAGSTYEPTQMLRRFHVSDAKPNHEWSDPNVAALIEKQEKTLDPKERAKVLSQLFDYMDENMPAVCIWYAPWYRAWDTKFHNLKAHPSTGSMLPWADIVWKEK